MSAMPNRRLKHGNSQTHTETKIICYLNMPVRTDYLPYARFRIVLGFAPLKLRIKTRKCSELANLEKLLVLVFGLIGHFVTSLKSTSTVLIKNVFLKRQYIFTKKNQKCRNTERFWFHRETDYFGGEIIEIFNQKECFRICQL